MQGFQLDVKIAWSELKKTVLYQRHRQRKKQVWLKVVYVVNIGARRRLGTTGQLDLT